MSAKPERLIAEAVDEVKLIPCALTCGDLRKALLRFRDDAEVGASLESAGDVFFPARLKLQRVSSEVTLHPDGTMTTAPRLVLLPSAAFEIPG